MRILKIVLISVFSILIVLAILFGLVRLHFIKPPTFLTALPVVGTHFVASPEPEENNPANENRESEVLAEKEKEIKSLKQRLDGLEKQLKASQTDNDKMREQVALLNQELLELKIEQTGQQTAYRDVAAYFTEMKSGDAADILSRLPDEDIIGILNEMEDDLVGEILQKMDRNKATIITRKMLVISKEP